MCKTHRATLFTCLTAVLTLGLAAPIQAQPVANPNDPFQVGPVVNPGAGSNPYSTIGPQSQAVMPNSYSTTLSGALTPWYYNPYGPYNDPYSYWGSRAGDYLRGVSDVVDSQGRFMINEEYARQYRELARQEQFKSKKMALDLKLYLRANTPTFTDDQIKIAAERLERIRKVASPTEIWSGRALNVLLAELEKYRANKVPVPPIKLSEDILSKVNITFGNNGNLGVLRDGGRINWPGALLKLIPEEDRKDFSIYTQQLVGQAASGTPNANILEDLNTAVERFKETLRKKVNDIPTGQYLEANRFLSDLEDALRALRSNSVAVQYYQFRNFIKGGKTIDQVIAYMQENGLRFAPATEGDENAYRAMYNAVANYDIAVNTQLASAAPVSGNP